MTSPAAESAARRLVIDRIDDEGAGVARDGSGEWIVPGAFPGETVLAAPVARSRHRATGYARLTRVVEPSAARVESACARHPARGGRCTGCPLLELELESQRRAKLASLRSLGLEIDRVVGDSRGVGYRWSAKRVAFRRGGAVALGSYERRSHRPADMRGCVVDHPLISAAADTIADAATSAGVAPWDERAGRGELEAVWLRTDGERVLVTLVTHAPADRAERALAAALLGRSGISGIAASRRAGQGNSLRGGPARPLGGELELQATIAGAPLRIGPLGFLQPNPIIAALAYRDLLGTEAGDRLAGREAWDLYAGAGVTTRLLAERFERVIPCESAAESAAALGVAPEAVQGFLERAVAQQREPPDLVVANPPRAGLGEAVCDRLARARAPRITVMSCGPAALARDLASLEASGYARRGVRAYDTLPATAHIELVAWLERT